MEPRRASSLLRAALAASACVVALSFVPPGGAGPEGVLAPSVTYTLDGTVGDNGWFRSDVTVRWTVSPTQGLIKTTGCEPAVQVPGDTSGATLTCTAEWSDGTTIIRNTVPAIKIDETAPTGVSGTAARAPNANGWYRTSVGVSFGGSDAMSGIASCTSTTYGGPDGADVPVSGSCRDKAGNVTGAALRIDFDAAAPAVTGAAAERAPNSNGWYRSSIRVLFSGSDATSGIAS